MATCPRPFVILAALALLVVGDLTVGPSAVFRKYCGPTYVEGSYVSACRVELGTIIGDLREMLRAKNRVIDPARPFNRPLRHPRFYAA